MNHFIDLAQIEAKELRAVINTATLLKKNRAKAATALKGKMLAMIFEKNSTRTRVSFEVGMLQLGGHALFLNGKDTQLNRGEPVADTAKVLSRYVDMIVLRCHAHAGLEEMAAHATIPVINGLTDFSHPCQIMADIMTFEERRGPIQGKKVAWIGDGNNVCNSFISAASSFEFNLTVACPETLMPHPKMLAWAQAKHANIEVTHSPQDAARDADLVVTDTWVSMGDDDAQSRNSTLALYQVDDALMKLALKDALFMHCLPAHRGEEVTASVIDGPQSVVWDEAENRLHVQKAIMLWCMGKLF